MIARIEVPNAQKKLYKNSVHPVVGFDTIIAKGREVSVVILEVMSENLKPKHVKYPLQNVELISVAETIKAE